ncbi:hypothetical protein HOH51_01665 [bacterium]|nr:hypothetical protein [bacterium]
MSKILKKALASLVLTVLCVMSFSVLSLNHQSLSDSNLNTESAAITHLQFGAATAYAVADKPFIPLPDEQYQKNFVVTKGDTSLQKTAFLTTAAGKLMKLILIAIASLMAIISAIQIIVGRGRDENAMADAKKVLLYSVLGIGVIMISSELGRILSLADGGFFGAREEVLARFKIFDLKIQIIITFLKYIVAAVAIFFMTKSGMRLIFKATSEDEVTKDKEKIVLSGVGLIAMLMANNLITNIFYRIDNPFTTPEIDPSQGVLELIGFTNFIVTFVSPILILTLIVGAVMVSASGFSEDSAEKGKKMIKLSIAGIILIYGSFAIVSTIIAGSF